MMAPVRPDLPSGTVTFLFTDVEGSTRLLHELGPSAYAQALSEHRWVVREAVGAHGGVEVDTQGDAFFVAFPTAPGALEAAAEALAGLDGGPVRVRMGIHTGTPLVTDEGYVGEDVHRAARIAACGHGGQVLVSSTTASLINLELVDLGLHRLKDLSAPEQIYQLGGDEFPALKSLYRTNLPIPATAFLGREKELDDVGALLARDDVRLLTLTGPGGTGKTRLALQSAAEASDSFPDGVFWVPLAALRDPVLVMETAGQALGAKDGLAEHVADKSLLLLLDNFEHLVEAAEDVAVLLGGCPNLKVLVTSRERLRVRGEQTWPVPPLAADDGTQLFAARAQAVDPLFIPSAAVAELCARLDELPLAIELAAARTAVFSPEQLLERLSQRLDLLKGDRDADPRQQTLRTTIAWSHDLLTGDEQHLFRRLSVFAGGCTYEAAEQVTGADPDTLQSLLDKSLLRKLDDTTGEPRYWMLETIREYAVEQLDYAGEADAVHRRHADHYLALAEEAERHLRSGGSLARLEAEHDNLRAALDRLRSAADPEGALRLAAALREFWQRIALVVEGRRRLEDALDADQEPTAIRVSALNGIAALAAQAGDLTDARSYAEEALILSRTLGDAWSTADSLWTLGYVLSEQDELATALSLVEEAVRLFREAGDAHLAAQATRTVGFILIGLGEGKRGQALHEENLAWARASGDKIVAALSLGSLAMAIVDEGRSREALSLLAEAYVIHRELGNRGELLTQLCRFALAYAYERQATTAVQLLAAATALREDAGYRVQWVDELNDDTLAITHSQLDDDAFAEVWERGRTLTFDQAVALALESID